MLWAGVNRVKRQPFMRLHVTGVANIIRIQQLFDKSNSAKDNAISSSNFIFVNRPLKQADSFSAAREAKADSCPISPYPIIRN